ncbi:hypothetical protein D3C87_264690 [compost metagenome]|uniref:hypothetical protein n=1 Tax=Achromobacter sp. Root83 TaxID=1736602 RepID=UPI00070C7009|nr:hypothetical protein [Achromobacter sp. Root83]KRC76253.1 hypothetical protein ASE30_06475 [Achromobacter sp. Root83]
MPSRPIDPGIPTLTQRAEPSLYGPAGDDDAPVLTELADDAGLAYADDAFPVLTDMADDAGASASPQPLAAAPQPAAPLPDATVLTARLQAEVEQLMREALADAIEQIQARMDAELPAIVARVLNAVRPG